MRQPFFDRFQKLSRERDTLLCVGLDPDPARIPGGDGNPTPAVIFDFLKEVVQATAPLAAAFKPNIAFFEALGAPGWQLFADLVQEIRRTDPEILIIADAKRGDIGNTAAAYARAFYQELDCDAITLSPYMGADTIEPFLTYEDRAAIVLCLTSNAGAPMFQAHGEPQLHLTVAAEMQKLKATGKDVWMVVGATKSADQMRKIREAAPDVPWLVPGVGAQGGSMQDVLEITGGQALINASRSILYATENRSQVAEASRKAAEEMVAEMRSTLR